MSIDDLYEQRVVTLIDLGMNQDQAVTFVKDTFKMLTSIHQSQMNQYDAEMSGTGVSASEYFESENMIISMAE